MSWKDKYIQFFQKYFPSTLTLTLGLSLITFLLAYVLTYSLDHSSSRELNGLTKQNFYFLQLLGYWYAGLWDSSMLVFALQMMLILVLGYSLASTPLIHVIIEKMISLTKNPAVSVGIVAFFSMVMSWLNWGLGLITGAILARKTGEYFASKSMGFNYPMLAAAGYSGLMLWHGGLSGSAPLKVTEAGHLQALSGMPIDAVPLGETIFSSMNLLATFLCLLMVPLFFRLIYSPVPFEKALFTPGYQKSFSLREKNSSSDSMSWLSTMTGIILIFIALILFITGGNTKVINLNYINFVLLGLTILLHRNFESFTSSISGAMPAAGGILIQFPLYFGIMGIMKYSGLTHVLSQWIIQVSSPQSFPLLTFLSAAVVNIFIPSGGGQWVVQGPFIIHSAVQLHVPLSKAIMSLAYGDELTNMLQPFWALPLLGITGLKARDILPYTLLLMLLGFVIFILVLVLF